MLRLEDVEPGVLVEGLVPGRAVPVRALVWHGADHVEVIYDDPDTGLGKGLLGRADEKSLRLAAVEGSWPLDADGFVFKLASEARRIGSAFLLDPFAAVGSADIEPLPHQLEAVYRDMLPMQPLRFLLADDPGAGKTIMSGLYIRELIIRGDAARVLVVVPGSLAVQWQDELWERFQLDFRILTNDMVESSRSGNPFIDHGLLIARMDQVARRDDLREKLGAARWDLVVVDEAHKMSAGYYGKKLTKTKRYQLGEQLGGLARHLLLLTATPHSGSQQGYMLFLALLDPDQFGGKLRDGQVPDASGVMRRYVKEHLLTFEGKPLFPERWAHSAKYDLSEAEQHLYNEVTGYVRNEMGRAKQIELKNRRRGLVIGFALTALQRRLASSPEAIWRSLGRRRDRLSRHLEELEAIVEGQTPTDRIAQGLSVDDLEFFDYDDYDTEQIEQLETEVIDQATAAQTVPELQAEIQTLDRLVVLAGKVRRLETDTKWEQLSTVLQSDHMVGPDGTRRKIIVFTEHVDTLNYLRRRIVSLLGRPERVVVIHGSVRREARRHRQDAFINDPEVWVMVATDAAGEGVNLQRANLMVNYDLPWNPNRIEQRFGRIHRIGQTEVCHLWNLVAHNTREGAVFSRLLDKIEEQRKALGGQVYDVLGDSQIDRNLRELLIEAIRYGDQPAVRARLDQVIDHNISDRIRSLVEERALAVGDPTADLQEIRDEMERARLRKLQPGFISAFFVEALRHLRGRIVERERDRWEITRIPAPVRNQPGSPTRLQPRYERVTFHKELTNPPSKPPAELVALGHPLLEAVVDVVLRRHGADLQRGTILVDPQATDTRTRSLVQVEHSIANGTGRHVSRRYWTVETPEGGQPHETGAARHHDLRPPTPEEHQHITQILDSQQLGTELVDAARSHAIQQLCEPHLHQTRRTTHHRINKIRTAVEQRLVARIQYWDTYAHDPQTQKRTSGFTAGHARNIADELAERLEERNHQLDQQAQLTSQPPNVVGAALVIPQALLDQHASPPIHKPPAHARDTTQVDRRAVDAVLAAEKALDRHPTEMAHNNEGYDIESRDPTTGNLYFIEVKGRIQGADTITVSSSQINHAQNTPDRFILAIVEVPTNTNTPPTVQYARQPFDGVKVAFNRYAITFRITEFNTQPPS